MKSLSKIFLVIMFLFITNSCAQTNKERKKTDWQTMKLKAKVKSFNEMDCNLIKKDREIEKGEKKLKSYQIHYSKQGNIIKRITYNRDGSLYYIIKKKKEPNKSTHISYKPDGSLNYISSQEDLVGNKIVGNKHNHYGCIGPRFTSKYNKQGLIEIKAYNSSDKSLEYKLTIKYDEKGNQIESNYYSSDLIFKTTFKYDEKGNTLKRYIFNSDGSLKIKYSYKYQYDKKGNWINKIEFENDVPYKIIERTYEYFE